MKKLNILLTFNLLVIIFSGFGLSFTILMSPTTFEEELINTKAKVLGFEADEKCHDSDAHSQNISIYIPGEIKYYEDAENITYLKDHCIEDNKFLVEEFCEYNELENKVAVKSIVYKCEKGCKQGACIKSS